MTELLINQMPGTIPLFPLEGVLLLPGGDLPLVIFEPRYLAMVRMVMQSHEMIGMIQPCQCPEKISIGARPFYQVGCAGKISSIEETGDGRFLINLCGVARFTLLNHSLTDQGYRLAEVSYQDYAGDFLDPQPLPAGMSRACLTRKLNDYLMRHDMHVDWDQAAHIPDHRFYTLLAMICPFSSVEKQALLEAPDFEQRCQIMKSLMAMACAEETLSGSEHLC